MADDADGTVRQDVWAFLLCLGGALACTQTAHLLRGRVFSPAATRKACHIVVGIVYTLTWIPFSNHGRARWLAAAVVAAAGLQVVLVGLGLLKDRNLIEGMSRSGRPAELLRGPLIYAVVSAVWTVVWWRESASGIVGLQALFLGDGFAGLIGGLVSDLGPSLAHRLQWSPDKTWAGTIACFCGTLAGSAAFLRLFMSTGHLPPLGPEPGAVPWLPLLVTSIVAALVESLPVQDFDNLFVPIAATLTYNALT